ncbi:MAG: hypothetical protein AAFQ09_07090 [Pseudomonadota bacterium]
MRALILRHDPNAAIASSRALIDKGFQILCVDTRAAAEMLVRSNTIDLLLLDEQVQGELTHPVVLSGERNNPYISAILMTDRTREETDDLYDLIPSLYALAGLKTEASIIGQLALTSVTHSTDTLARIAENAAADKAEAEAPDVFAKPQHDETPLVLTEQIPSVEQTVRVADQVDPFQMPAEPKTVPAEPETVVLQDVASAISPEPMVPMPPQQGVRVPSLAARMRVGATLAALEADEKAKSPFARKESATPYFAEKRQVPPQPAA